MPTLLRPEAYSTQRSIKQLGIVSFLAVFALSVVDDYNLAVMWGDQPVEGSPFRFRLREVQARQVLLIPVFSLSPSSVLCCCGATIDPFGALPPNQLP